MPPSRCSWTLCRPGEDCRRRVADGNLLCVVHQKVLIRERADGRSGVRSPIVLATLLWPVLRVLAFVARVLGWTKQ